MGRWRVGDRYTTLCGRIFEVVETGIARLEAKEAMRWVRSFSQKELPYGWKRMPRQPKKDNIKSRKALPFIWECSYCGKSFKRVAVDRHWAHCKKAQLNK